MSRVKKPSVNQCSRGFRLKLVFAPAIDSTLPKAGISQCRCATHALAQTLASIAQWSPPRPCTSSELTWCFSLEVEINQCQTKSEIRVLQSICKWLQSEILYSSKTCSKATNRKLQTSRYRDITFINSIPRLYRWSIS